MELVDSDGVYTTKAFSLKVSLEVYEELIVLFKRLEIEGKFIRLPPVISSEEEADTFYESEAIHVWEIKDTNLAIDIYPRLHPSKGNETEYYSLFLNEIFDNNTYTYLTFEEFFESLSNEMKREMIFCFDLWLDLKFGYHPF
jgi:hypothetical protein